MEELDLNLKVDEEVFWLAAIPYDRWFGSCSETLTVGVGLAGEELVASLAPIVLLTIHVSVMMRGY